MMQKIIPFLSISLIATISHLRGDISRPFLPEAALKNHVLIVNVAGAIPDDDFAIAAERAFARVQINVWTSSIPTSVITDLVNDPELISKTFGDKTAIAVFVERNEKGPSFMQVPGTWSLVNLRGLDSDNPNRETLADRYAKMILKGLAHACGGGASLDPQCTMFYGSFTLSGIDKTKIKICPYTYFPMLETIRAVGGNEILAPVIPGEDNPQ